MVATAPPADTPPCRTLYIRNLPEKLPKAKLRELLHAAASPHGAVTWIAAAKTLPLRGQAFVTFADLGGATTALRELNGAQFVGRELAVCYARSESDRAAPDRGAAKRARAQGRAEREETERAEKDEAAKGADGVGGEGMDVEMEIETAGEEGGVGGTEAAEGLGEPNRILFAEELPASATSGLLGDLFGRFAGFTEVRTVPGRKDIAFVEFGQEAEAAIALSGLQGHQFGEGKGMKLSYAKK